MIGFKATIEDKFDRIRRAERDAQTGSFKRTAFVIRRDAIESIERADGPSDPPNPPHTHRGNWFRRAIRYAADKNGAVIGPMASIVDDVGQAHEFGGSFRGQIYPKRPTMGPALENNIEFFAGTWSGSIGN